MKNLKNDLKAWLLLCSGLGTILFLMGSTFYTEERRVGKECSDNCSSRW